MNGLKSKFKIYAIFQFLTLVATALLFATLAMLVYQEEHLNGLKVSDQFYWSTVIEDALSFRKAQWLDGVVTSLFIYLTIFLWISTWITGIMIVRIKNRNLFDSLFLLFFMLPVISNFFAFFAQLTLKTKDYTPSKIDKEAIKKDIEKILNESTNKK